MENEMSNATSGLRERKRLETLDRIARVGLDLFVAKGYEATTLDDIAAAAGISRRTFFYYFKSKDDILVALQCEPAVKALGEVFQEIPAGAKPLEVLVERLPNFVGAFETAQTRVIADIMQSTDALKVRKLAIYIDLENALLEALKKAWPDASDAPALCLLTTVSMGVLRLSMDQWRQEDGTRRLADYVRENFRLLSQQA